MNEYKMISLRLSFLLLVIFELNMAQNPFYGDYTPPSDQNYTTNNYDRYNTDRYDSNNNRYNNDQYNNRNNDPYNRNNDSNNRYDPNYRNNDPNNRYDPYNRNNDSNNRYDPYNRDRYNDNNSRYNNDQYNRYNQDYRYNSSNPQYNLGSDLNPNYRNDYNRYNNDSNRYRNNDPNNRYNDPNNRYNDPNNRYNDPNNRYNDPNNRYNDPNNRYNDPNNRYNDPNNRYNDPNNRNNDRYNDPNSRYNQDNRFNDQNNRPYDSGFGNQYGGGPNDPNDNCCEEYCYRNDQNPWFHFGSKTAYELVYGKRQFQEVPECSPVQVWSINRHATRLPTDQEIRRLRNLENLRSEIIKNYDEKRSYPYKGRLCKEDVELLRRWRWNETLSEGRGRTIARQGIEDAKYIARRYKSKFGSLLNQNYRDNYYNFQYDTSDYKTHDTYQAYIEGLFDLSKTFNVHANTQFSERTLPPSYCRTLAMRVENNNYTFSEYDRFKQKPEYIQMVRDVFKRLGFRYTLNEALVRDMYDMCRYEKAWYLDSPSPWCAVFTKRQMEMLEYAEDLQDYYYAGYGNEANARVGCLLVKDMYELMRRTVNGEPEDAYKVSHYFTHSSQFLRFLTALGVAKDYNHLTADNYYQQKNRQWKLSLIDPFAANLMAVLYNCQRENKHKVMFILNETPVNFPECSVGLCDWHVFEDKIRNIADNCNKDYCTYGGSPRTFDKVSFALILILSLSVFHLM